MSTKRCSKCGWEYPFSAPLARCRFCGEPFEGGPCTKCGAHVEKWKPSHRMCDKCATESFKASNEGRYEKYLAEATQKYEDWKKRIKAAPPGHLTEEQWIAACRYFGGCSICGSEQIDTRGFFIKFREGGRYAIWNVVPMCSECNTINRKQPNPWIYLDPNAGNGTGDSKIHLQNIVDYLSERIRK